MLGFVAGDFEVFSCWNGVLGFHRGPRNIGEKNYSTRARKRHTFKSSWLFQAISMKRVQGRKTLVCVDCCFYSAVSCKPSHADT